MKHCRYCGQDKPPKAFSVRHASTDGLSFKCRECASAYAKARYASNSVPAKERASAWAKANPSRRREIARSYDDRNRIAKRQRSSRDQRRFRERNPELWAIRNRAAAHARRAREVGRVDVSHVLGLFDRAAGVCVYCLTSSPLTIDHMIAVAKGGDNGNENIIPCCKSCNSSKNASPIDEWLMRHHGIEGLARTVAFLEGNPNWRKLVKACHGIDVVEV